MISWPLFLVSLAVAQPPSCSQPLPAFQNLYVTDWAFTADQLQTLYERHYLCAQRQLQDAFVPQADGSARAVKRADGEPPAALVVPAAFVEATRAHIEAVLAGKHARHLFFPDFSHGHLYLDETLYAQRYAPLAAQKRWTEFYEALLADPDLKVLYHSQEMWAAWQHPREFLASDGALAPATGAPANARHICHVRFRAHPQGFYALPDGTRYDLSFQDDTWDEGASRLGFVVTF